MSSKFYRYLAFISPFTIIVLTSLYLTIKYHLFWVSQPSNTAGSMMVFSEVVTLVVMSIVAFFIGSAFSIKSILVSKGKMGVTALVINLSPLLIIAFFYIRLF